MLPFIGATLAAILGLAAVLFVRRRRALESS
jgi:LPXTG-motif cell wall-anchored protein